MLYESEKVVFSSNGKSWQNPQKIAIEFASSFSGYL